MTKLLTSEEVAEQLGLTSRTLLKWRSEGKGPDFIRIANQRVRYTQADVDRWINEQRVQMGNK
ncbi:MAG: helix-turn-helix domain-containing protein [Microbacteriaceae bacterium]